MPLDEHDKRAARILFCLIIGVGATLSLHAPAFFLNYELKELHENLNAGHSKYPAVSTTLDSYAEQLAAAGGYTGEHVNWRTISGAKSEDFGNVGQARKFIKRNDVLSSGSPKQLLSLHARTVRSDIVKYATRSREQSPRSWTEGAIFLANQFFEICRTSPKLCKGSREEIQAIDEWISWFNKGPLSEDFYIKIYLDPERLAIERLPKAFVNVCNFAPYVTRHLVVAIEEGEIRRVGDWFDLQPGECVRRMQIFFEGEPAFYVHSDINSEARAHLQYVNGILNRQLLSDDDPDNDSEAVHLSGAEFQAWGHTLACAPRQEALVASPSTIQAECQRGQYEGRFAQTYALDDSGEWYYFFESPNLYMFEFGSSVASAVRLTQDRAQKTATAIDWQQFYDHEWRGEYPFSPGGSLVDFNGPLMPGVQLTSASTRDLYGRPLGLLSGDILLEVNGQSVFGISDANQLLIEHGLSREKGVEVPVSYSIFRDGQNHRIESTYFFNPGYRSQGSDQSGIAFWYGVGDAVGFGQTPEIVCYGGNVLRFFGNAVGAAIEGVDAWINERQFDKSSFNTFSYYDASECNWQKHQNRALAMQMEESTYQDSQWFAIISPSAVRMLGSKALQRQARKQLGRSMGGRVSSAALEVLETSLWSMGTEPPGTPIGERLSSVKKLAPIAAAGGAAPLATIGAFATSFALKQNAVGFEGE